MKKCLSKNNAITALICLTLIVSIWPKNTFAQNNSNTDKTSTNFADKEFYLIDSLQLDSLNDGDKYLLDSCLHEFKNQTPDSSRLKTYLFLIKNLTDLDVGFKYSVWLENYINKRLSENLTEGEIRFLNLSLVGALMNKGVKFDNDANPEAAKAYHKCLKIYEEFGTDLDVSQSLNNLGVYYAKLNKIDDAIHFYSKALKASENLDNEGEASLLNNLGLAYLSQEKYDTALTYLKQGLEIRKNLEQPGEISTVLNSLGVVYTRLGDLRRSDSCYQGCLTLLEEMEQTYPIKMRMAPTLHNLARLKHKLGKINGKGGALDLTNRSLKISKELEILGGIASNAGFLSQLYVEEEMWKEALTMHKLQDSIQAKFNSQELRDELAEQKAKYEYEKRKELDDAISQKEFANQKLKSNQQRTLIYLIGAGMVIAILTIVIIVRRLRQVRQKQEIAAKQRDVAEAMRSISEQKASELSLKVEHEKLSSEMALLKSQISPHFLFNTLNNIYSLAFVKSDDAPTMIAVLADVLRYLIYESTVDRVMLSSEIEILQKYLKIQELRRIPGANNSNLQIIGTPEQIKVPPLILITLAENVFKHGSIISEEDGYVNIEVKIDENQVTYYLENSYVKTKSAPGIGLKNIRGQLDLLFGESYKMDIKEEIDQGIFKVKLVFSSK